eukprot:Sdes_comp22453_c0_seq1m20909
MMSSTTQPSSTPAYHSDTTEDHEGWIVAAEHCLPATTQPSEGGSCEALPNGGSNEEASRFCDSMVVDVAIYIYEQDSIHKYVPVFMDPNGVFTLRSSQERRIRAYVFSSLPKYLNDIQNASLHLSPVKSQPESTIHINLNSLEYCDSNDMVVLTFDWDATVLHETSDFARQSDAMKVDYSLHIDAFFKDPLCFEGEICFQLCKPTEREWQATGPVTAIPNR